MALARDGSVLKKRPIRVTKVAVAGRGGAAKSARGKPVSTLGRLKVGIAAGTGQQTRRQELSLELPSASLQNP